MLTNAESDRHGRVRLNLFREGLEKLGWFESRNVQFDVRWGAGSPERARTYAAEIVAAECDAILANGTPPVADRLPAIYPFRHFAREGGLMAYGFDPPDLFRRSAAYIDRILKGAKPADLPVQAPTKFELIVNLKAAKTIGLSLAPTLLARADEVIE